MALARSTTLGGNNGTTGTVTTGSIANFTISGSDKVLYAVTQANDTPVLSPSVSWSGGGTPQGLTQIGVTTGTGVALNVFRLINPTDETNGTLSFSSLSGSVRDSFIGVLFTGVDQTTPNGTVNVKETTGADINSDTITCAAGNWIVGFNGTSGSAGATTVTGGGTQTLHLEQETGGNNGRCCVATDQDGADDSIDWDGDTAALASAITFELKAAGAGASAFPHHYYQQMRA